MVYYKTDYQNSGDAKYYGDKDRVVGYWALSVFSNDSISILSSEEQKDLLETARETIVYFLKTGKHGKPQPAMTEGVLQKPGGVFVSVYIDDELRGCMGNFSRTETLIDLVQRLAVASACDYRFKDILAEEIDKMKLEISVLTPLKKINSIDEIELGKHGIYIKKGSSSGTFLPQVASKTGWNLEQFLGHCARDKAGIGWDGWKNAEIYIFEAFIFRG
ncbi:MAG: AmmeMemoRadiSam system protein A [Prolixibacteraceae bacterium]|nr:AmmeMemoRadiSam system protein A [Prolixibacteraceae bacterium]